MLWIPRRGYNDVGLGAIYILIVKKFKSFLDDSILQA